MSTIPGSERAANLLPVRIGVETPVDFDGEDEVACRSTSR
jgi:hypothetical protein